MKIMMENKSELPEFEKSFDFSFASSSTTKIINSDAKNGFFWYKKKANPDDLIASLKKIFETGLTPVNEQNPMTKLPPVQSHPNFIAASNTIQNDEEFTRFDNEQLSDGMYAYIYLIESNHNINSLALCEENLDNPSFTTDNSVVKISEEQDYAISKVDPQCIIGAMPSALVAFALGLPKQSFITNPTYNKIFNCEKIKAAIGGDFLLIGSECFFTLNISRNDGDRRGLQTPKPSIQQTDLGASSSQNSQRVTFFPSNAADNPSFKETPNSPRP